MFPFKKFTEYAEGRFGVKGDGSPVQTIKKSSKVDVADYLLDNKGIPIWVEEDKENPLPLPVLKATFRKYFKAHYGTCLLVTKDVFYMLINITARASANPSATLPWRLMEEQGILRFVDQEYLPEGVIIRDPSRMREEDLHKIFDHWAERHGAGEEVFRFSHYAGSEEPQKAIYNVPTSSDSQDEEPSGKKSKESRNTGGNGKGKARGKGKGKAKAKGKGKGKKRDDGRKAVEEDEEEGEYFDLEVSSSGESDDDIPKDLEEVPQDVAQEDQEVFGAEEEEMLADPDAAFDYEFDQIPNSPYEAPSVYAASDAATQAIYLKSLCSEPSYHALVDYCAASLPYVGSLSSFYSRSQVKLF